MTSHLCFTEMSVTNTVQLLNQEEKRTFQLSDDTEQGFTAPAWVLEGIEIEEQQ
jgi:hypothetical protein